MTSLTRFLLVLMLLGCLVVAAPHPSANAQEAQFSLGVGQWVTVGQYTVLFRGLTELLPSYDLYVGSVLAAQFPLSGGGPPRGNEYAYANVTIVTTGVAPDGTAATGVIAVK